MSASQPVAPRGRIKPRTVLLILLVAAFTLFCAFNREPTRVWPFGGQLPLIVVILIAFAMGLSVGWLAKGLMGGRRVLAPDGAVAAMERNER